jgi:hypothetical protein
MENQKLKKVLCYVLTESTPSPFSPLADPTQLTTETDSSAALEVVCMKEITMCINWSDVVQEKNIIVLCCIQSDSIAFDGPVVAI